MALMIKVNPPGKGGSDKGYLGPEEEILRNNYTGLFVPLVSYPGAEIPKGMDERMHWFPGMEHFSPEHFVWALETVGWEYQGTEYDGRRPDLHTRVSENGRRTETETLPELLEYTIHPPENLEKIVMNAEKRMRTFYPPEGFSTPKHGEYLSEELREAGWQWDYRKCRFEVDTTVIVWNIWEGEKIPDIFEEYGVE